MKFEEVFKIDVNGKTEKKGNLTYLSWAWAWAEFKKLYPTATYKVNPFDGTFCSGNEKIGYMVQTSVTADDLTYEMWLPVMDMRNNTIFQPKMTEINKTIMRCLTKNLAMFGLGLYIYAGEDLPEGEDGENANAGGRVENTDKNKPSNGAKSNGNAKPSGKLTKAEMVEKWGVKNVEETVLWFEKKLGVEFKDWNEEETEAVRGVLEQRKAKRESDEAKVREGLKKAGDEVPFDV